MSLAPHKKLGELLIESKIIDQSQLRAALSNQKSYGGRLGTILVKMGFLKELDMLKFLSKQLLLPMVDLYKVTVEQKILELIPYDVAGKYNILPLAIKVFSGKPLLHVAMSDPTNLEAIDSIQFTAGYKIQPVLALDSSLTDFINFYYKGKEVPKQVTDIPMTRRDDELSLEGEQTITDEVVHDPEPGYKPETNLQTESRMDRPANRPGDQPDKQSDKLLPFIKAIIALLIKKGIFSAEEFKQALTNEYKNKP